MTAGNIDIRKAENGAVISAWDDRGKHKTFVATTEAEKKEIVSKLLGI